MPVRSPFILFLILSITLMPSIVFACASGSEKSCCKKEITKSETKSNCTETSPTPAGDEDCEGNCGGDCGHNNCHCSGTTLHVLFIATTKSNVFQTKVEKQFFPKRDTPPSSGFLSIWLPPKIS